MLFYAPDMIIWGVIIDAVPGFFDLLDFFDGFLCLESRFANKGVFENHLKHVRVGVWVDYWLKNLIKYQPFDQTQNYLSFLP